jgi:8-oxo-dGTP pyrophosphatase MutT (NUDIX family)
MHVRVRSLFKHPPAGFFRLFGRLPARVRHLLMSLAAHRITLGVSAIILDEHGRLLLARHTYRQPMWDYPSGLVGLDEQPSAALVREIGEELDTRATVGPLLHAENHQGMGHLTLYYRVFLQGAPRCRAAEIDDCRYVPVDEIHSLTGHPPPAWLVRAHDEMRAGGAHDR